jgi:tRNA U34 5-carboxymethylaminomethyl modifying GTPase MnmE/TrmE
MFKKILLSILIIFASSISYAEEEKSITKKEFLDSNVKKLEQQFDQIDANKDQKITAAEEYKNLEC